MISSQQSQSQNQMSLNDNVLDSFVAKLDELQLSQNVINNNNDNEYNEDRYHEIMEMNKKMSQDIEIIKSQLAQLIKVQAEQQALAVTTAPKRNNRRANSKYCSNIAEQFAIDHNVNPDEIEGSGKDNKITKRDVKQYLKRKGLVGKNKNYTETDYATTDTESVSIISKKKKNPCNAITVSGAKCSMNGSKELEGEYYCGRHFKDAKEKLEKQKFRQKLAKKRNLDNIKYATYSDSDSDSDDDNDDTNNQSLLENQDPPKSKSIQKIMNTNLSVINEEEEELVETDSDSDSNDSSESDSDSSDSDSDSEKECDYNFNQCDDDDNDDDELN